MEKLLYKQWRNCLINNGETASETMEKLLQKQWRNCFRNNGEIVRIKPFTNIIE